MCSSVKYKYLLLSFLKILCLWKLIKKNLETVSAWPELASILVAVPARMELHKDFKRSRPLEVLKDDDSVAEELQKSEDSNRKCQKYCKWTHA